VQTQLFLSGISQQFRWHWIAEKARETVPDGLSSNGISPAAVPDHTMFYQVPESSFNGVRVADRVQKTVRGGWTINGKIPTAVRVESVTQRYVQ